ncbi:MAG TPA: 2-C-methyl-D-erythritol 4-phosphate cytidylyltransferase [Acidimicrobiales bacterium]|nr:2-C-methyl-D-erythritol 4-phosphate cytidylyltransferase [Acidimicrobiales bacterium]
MWAIVVAGGSGQRFGQMKQFAPLHGRPVLQWAVEACRPAATGVVLVVPESAPLTESYAADVVVEGGATRSESVRRGLAEVPSSAEIIVVHDAARPLASPELFRAVIAAITGGGADGAVPGVPVGDTIKVVDDSGNVTTTLDRSTLVAVQTPQAFRADLLRRAHAGGTGATDDAALVEALGATVRVIGGEARNLKITTPDDLRTAEQLLVPGP